MNALSHKKSVVTEGKNLADLFRTFPERTYEKGKAIFTKNCSSKEISYVLVGKILTYSMDEVGQKELVNGYFMEDSFLNLSSLSYNAPRNQSAIAITKTIVKVIPILNFHQLLNTTSFLRQEVLQRLLKTANRNQVYLHRMVSMSSKQRIQHFLLDYVADVGQRVGYEWVIRAPFSMTEIGQLTHTSRQSTSTLMNEIKRAGIIHFNRKYLIIRSLKKLKALVHHHESNCLNINA